MSAGFAPLSGSLGTELSHGGGRGGGGLHLASESSSSCCSWGISTGCAPL